MKFEIPTDTIKQIADIVKTLVSFKDDDYNHLLLEVAEDEVIVASSDASVAVTVKLPTKDFPEIAAMETGTCLVEASTLIKTVGSIKPFSEKDNKGTHSINLSKVDDKAKLAYTTFYDEVKMMDHERRLPVFEDGNVRKVWLQEFGDKFILFQSEALHRAISSVTYASGIDEMDMNLGNISFEVKEDGGKKSVVLTTTNSIKLARATIDLPNENYGNLDNFLLPTRLAKKLLKIIDASDQENEVVFSLSERNRLLIRPINNYVTVSSPVYIGGFPTCDHLLDGSTNATILNKELLFDCVLGLYQISDVDENRLTMEFDGGKCNVFVSGNTSGKSNAIETTGVAAPRTFDFNAKLLIDTLKNIATDRVRIKFFDDGGPNRVGFQDVPNSEEDFVSFDSILVPLRRF